jgi:hypothetical protein
MASDGEPLAKKAKTSIDEVSMVCKLRVRLHCLQSAGGDWAWSSAPRVIDLVHGRTIRRRNRKERVTHGTSLADSDRLAAEKGSMGGSGAVRREVLRQVFFGACESRLFFSCKTLSKIVYSSSNLPSVACYPGKKPDFRERLQA